MNFNQIDTPYPLNTPTLTRSHGFAIMVHPVLASFIVSDFIFLATGMMLIAAATVWTAQGSAPPTTESVGRQLLLLNCPLVAVLANGILVIITFVLSLPAFALPNSRTWLKLHSWGVVVCLVFTLALGVNEWIQTLTTRANLEDIWGKQSDITQSMLQRKVRLVEGSSYR